MKLAALIVVALVVPGGSIALLVYLRRRRFAKEAETLDIAITGYGYALDARRSGQVLDESLQARARARREIAEKIRKRSALVAAGSSSAAVLQMVKKA